MKLKKKKKKIKKINIYFLITSIILLILDLLNTILILKYDILPGKYLTIYLVFAVLIPVIFLLFLLRKKTKTKTKIILSIIEILLSILLGCTFYYMNQTFHFINKFTSGYNYETKNYLVLVLNDSAYQDLADIEDEKIGYVDIGKNFKEALEKLEDEITFNKEEYKDYTIMLNDLDKKSLSAVLILDSYYEALHEENKDLENKYKILYKFSLTEKTVDIKKEVNVTKDVFNIYISGIDTYASISSVTRSDVNIFVSINPKTHQILMINIPRDYYVELSGYNQKDKLTHAGMYGTETSVKTIENLLDTKINYYVKVNYNALIKIVDALGGVDVYSKYAFTSGELYYSYKKGYNHVNGKQALEFVRTRKAFKEGDRVRGENQQAMIQAIIKKAVNPSILTKYSTILSSLQGSFITNMSTDKITDLVKMQLDKMPNWNITSISLNGSDSSQYTYTYPNQKLYVMEPDMTTVLNAKTAIEDVLNGKILDDTYVENTGNVNTPTVNAPKETPSQSKDTSINQSSSDSSNLNSNSNTNTNTNTSDTNQESNLDTDNKTPSVDTSTSSSNSTDDTKEKTPANQAVQDNFGEDVNESTD